MHKDIYDSIKKYSSSTRSFNPPLTKLFCLKVGIGPWVQGRKGEKEPFFFTWMLNLLIFAFKPSACVCSDQCVMFIVEGCSCFVLSVQKGGFLAHLDGLFVTVHSGYCNPVFVYPGRIRCSWPSCPPQALSLRVICQGIRIFQSFSLIS